MFTFLIKLLFVFGLIAGASVVAMNNVPALRAQVLEVVNPRVKEARLIEELSGNLQKLEEIVIESSEEQPEEEVLGSQVIVVSAELIEDSQKILDDINDINDDNTGLVRNTVTRLVDLLTNDDMSEEGAPTHTPLPVDGSQPASETQTPLPCIAS